MAQKWYVKDKEAVLFTLINKKRYQNNNYNFVRDNNDLNNIIKKEANPGESRLNTIIRLIKEVRDEGKIL